MQPLPDNPSSEPKLIWGVLFSAIFHCLLILILVGIPSFSTPKRTYFSSAYMVKLVDAPRVKPAGVKASKGGGKVVVKEATPKPKKADTKKKTETKAAAKKQPKKTKEVKKTSQKKGTGLTVEDASKKKSSSAKSVAKKAKADDAESACRKLINLANLGSGEDNVSVIVVRIVKAPATISISQIELDGKTSGEEAEDSHSLKSTSTRDRIGSTKKRKAKIK